MSKWKFEVMSGNLFTKFETYSLLPDIYKQKQIFERPQFTMPYRHHTLNSLMICTPLLILFG
jgi:hypothetical protein